jgi:hypothetical protein
MDGRSSRSPGMEENCRESQESTRVVALTKNKKTFRDHLSVPSSKAGYECGDDWKWGPVFIPGPRCTGSSGTNGERGQWVGAVQSG